MSSSSSFKVYGIAAAAIAAAVHGGVLHAAASACKYESFSRAALHRALPTRETPPLQYTTAKADAELAHTSYQAARAETLTVGAACSVSAAACVQGARLATRVIRAGFTRWRTQRVPTTLVVGCALLLADAGLVLVLSDKLVRQWQLAVHRQERARFWRLKREMKLEDARVEFLPILYAQRPYLHARVHV